MLRSGIIATVLLAAMAAGQPVLADDPVAGEVLSEVWCSSCHAVRPDDPTSDAAPSFDTIVNVYERSPEFLWGWLAHPHGAMPNPNLSRGEIDDIVSYMETLRDS